jgi:acetyl-CoA carboxylase carboxyltransferase component
LTTVLEPAPPHAAAEAPSAPAATSATVTEPSQAVALSPEAKLSEAEAFRLEEQLLHRVLQRVDLSLEERVSDAVSAAVQLHLDTMIPGLRREIEAVLRALVSEALARELSDNPGSTPAFGRETLG